MTTPQDDTAGTGAQTPADPPGPRFYDLSELTAAAEPTRRATSPPADPPGHPDHPDQSRRTMAVGPRAERTRLVSDPPGAGPAGSGRARGVRTADVPAGVGTTVRSGHRPGHRTGDGPRIDYDFHVADDPTPWPDADGGSDALLALPDRDRLPALESMTAGGRRMVVIVTRAQEQRVRALAAAARSLFDARIAVVTVDRGPALRAAAALIGQITTTPAGGRPAAEIIERLPGLVDRLGHLVLLKAVHRVDDPAVGFAHHLLSYLPGHRLFVLQTTPPGALARIDRHGRFRPERVAFAPAGFDPAHGVSVHVLGPRALPDGLLERLGVTGPPAQMSVPFSPYPYWPDTDATEVVLMPQDLAGWVRAELPAPERWPCRWCGEPLAAPVHSCPFCADTLR